jgi:hypothetical protein
MQFCYSDMTFNFKLKSHAYFSGSDRREKVQAEEIFVFKGKKSSGNEFVAGPESEISTARDFGKAAAPRT